MSDHSVYVHLENVCARRRLEIEKIKLYLDENGYGLVQTPQEAKDILLFGCAFNTHTEEESAARLDEFMSNKTEEQRVIALEGIADTRGKQIVKDGMLPKEQVIRTGDFDQLDHFYKNKVGLNDMPEQNLFFFNKDNIIPSVTVEERKEVPFYVQVGVGCQDNCSFCGDKVVVKNLKSKPVAAVIEEVKKGVALGHGHIWLVGDDAGAYGLDIGSSLSELLLEITKLEGDFELSIQEAHTKYLIQQMDGLEPFFKSGRMTCLALAYQSGNDRILELMDRGYTRDQIKALCDRLAINNINTHAHVLVGFPTETREEFKESCDILVECGFSSATFFIYQDRKTARAHKLEPKVPEEEKLARIEIAREYFGNLGYRFGVPRPDKLQVYR